MRTDRAAVAAVVLALLAVANAGTLWLCVLFSSLACFQLLVLAAPEGGAA